MTFKLDTSGAVCDNRHGSVAGRAITRWEDLTPFTQGYVGAMFASSQPLNKIGSKLGAFMGAAGFSDLAPETLARIIADCEAFQASPAHDHGGDRKAKGAALWKARNAVPNLRSARYRFPPLTVQLGDDGKVRFA